MSPRCCYCCCCCFATWLLSQSSFTTMAAHTLVFFFGLFFVVITGPTLSIHTNGGRECGEDINPQSFVAQGFLAAAGPDFTPDPTEPLRESDEDQRGIANTFSMKKQGGIGTGYLTLPADKVFACAVQAIIRKQHQARQEQHHTTSAPARVLLGEEEEEEKVITTTTTKKTKRRRTSTAAPVTCVDECEPCPACASCPSPPTTPSPSSSPCPSGPFAGSDTATYASSAVNAVFMAVVGVLLSFIKKYRDRAVRLQGDNDTLRQQQSSPTVSRAAAMPSPIFVPYSSSTHVNIAGEDMELTQQIPDPLG